MVERCDREIHLSDCWSSDQTECEIIGTIVCANPGCYLKCYSVSVKVQIRNLLEIYYSVQGIHPNRVVRKGLYPQLIFFRLV